MESKTLPVHVGFIIDGNGRWAKAHHVPQLEGHRRGYEKVKDLARWCKRRGIKVVTVYAFSTENWRRPAAEVSYLMDLNRLALGRDLPELQREGVRLRVIGRRNAKLPPDLVSLITAAEAHTADAGDLLLQIALDYGGRAEIVAAVQEIIRAGIPADQVTEETVAAHLWTSGVPDPDLIVRTSGELRTSGFLTFQAVYSELYFTPTLWPDFSEAELDQILAAYAERQRRFGGR
ncbi:MAG: undecaprenyl diphosphate synthase [Parcubacteria group bacterium Gr01-1014_31]|nr:MAG: undecaprenyl diphosphate synthase [Parcubacteria group bacterium Gr01-1014_31]